MNHYRISKYNPQFRTEGKYLLDEWTSISDVGKIISNHEFTMKEYERVEKNYINFVTRILHLCGIKQLRIHQLENYDKLHWYNKQYLDIAHTEEFVRDCLREKC